MGALKSIKKIFITPYKAIENKFIPIVNSVNNYLDKWFPQDKWNWRKISVFWAILQAIIIGSLEFYIFYQYSKHLDNIRNYQKANTNNGELCSVAQPISVYHIIFMVALFYQFYLICDTITKSSTLQLIAVTLFSFALASYSIVQFTQVVKGDCGYNNTSYYGDNANNNEKKVNIVKRPKNFEILIIILSFIFSFGWIIISLRLYKVFGWNVFKQLGADIGVKNRLKLYQIFLTLLKIDFFFFISFTLQFLIFIISSIKGDSKGAKVKYITIFILVLIFIMPFIGFGATKKENYRLMTLFLLLLSISIGYMTYSAIDIFINTDNRYKDCQNSLSLAAKYFLT